MKKLLEYLPFHFTLSLIIGITSQFNFRIWSFGFSRIIYVFVILLIILILLRKSKYYFIGVWGFFFYVGVTTVYIQNPRNNLSYYQNHVKENSTALLVIDKMLKAGSFYHRYEASIIQVDNTKTIGIVLLNIQKDSTRKILKVDDIIFLKPEIKKLTPPLNPHQFNYSSYLRKQGIYHQVFIQNSNYKLLDERRYSILGIAYEIRKSIQEALKKYSFKKDQLAILNALLLGQRQEVSKELIDEYSKAGAIHILAISGLHVGIILLIFSSLLKPLERIRRGKIYKTILLIALLWMFAIIAGLSASVVRAVTMFTFVAFGMFINRKNSVMNSLILSAFFLLLIHPLFLFDVGFQLSYLAVFGIVWVQPKLAQLWKPKYKLINKLWQLLTVSIAAQFGILPLSLYYFHQFPGLFMLSNLVIIPFLGSILVGGILIIVLALIGILPEIVAKFYGTIISWMNGFIRFISEQEDFLFTDISFSGYVMISSYLLILSVGALFSKLNPKRLLTCLASIILFQSILTIEKYERQQQNEFIVFHKSRNTVVGLRKKDSLHVYHDVPHDNKGLRIIESYKVGEEVFVSYKERMPNFFQIGEQVVLVIDKKGIYHFKKNKGFGVMLTQSPKVNLQRLIAELQPKIVIADGSNYKSMVQRWKETCIKSKTPFWYTGQNGAYIIRE